MKRNEIILDIQDVTVSFDGFKALNSLSLEIGKNKMLAIIKLEIQISCGMLKLRILPFRPL